MMRLRVSERVAAFALMARISRARVRGGAERGVPPAERPLAPSMATMDATHKQVTARLRLGANDGARAFGADADDDGVVAGGARETTPKRKGHDSGWGRNDGARAFAANAMMMLLRPPAAPRGSATGSSANTRQSKDQFARAAQRRRRPPRTQSPSPRNSRCRSRSRPAWHASWAIPPRLTTYRKVSFHALATEPRRATLRNSLGLTPA